MAFPIAFPTFKLFLEVASRRAAHGRMNHATLGGAHRRNPEFIVTAVEINLNSGGYTAT